MNRTFSFENLYLEIAWVHNEQEIKSDLVKPTGLWQRAEYFKNNYAPFGLIIRNNKESDRLFDNAYKYQAEYFQKGMAFEILQNADRPGLPWTCRMPFGKDNKERVEVNHENKISFLTESTFQYYGSGDKTFLEEFKNEKRIHFIESDKSWLTLTFDDRKQGLKKIFEPLQLTIEY